MCFEIPSKIIFIKDKKAKVDHNGHKHNVSLDLIKNVKVGDYVMVQGDYAISKMDKKDVKEIIDLLKDKTKRREDK